MLAIMATISQPIFGNRHLVSSDRAKKYQPKKGVNGGDKGGCQPISSLSSG